MQYLKVLFSTGSYVDTLKRFKYLRLVLNQDSLMLADYEATTKALETESKTLVKEKEKLDEIIKKVKNKDEEILAEKNSKENLLRKVKREKRYYLRVIKELDASAKKLETLAAKLLESSNAGSDYQERFTSFKGVLEPPVSGDVFSYFGKEKVSKFNSYLFNNGVKFSAKIGQEVRSVFTGEVVYADWFRGYGKVIIIGHGEGYHVIYSHLSKISTRVGDKVSRGDVIAASGDTGSITGACLYFEIRKNGRSVDPIKWLEPLAGRKTGLKKIDSGGFP